MLKDGGPGAAVGAIVALVLTVPMKCQPVDAFGHPTSELGALQKCTDLMGNSFTGSYVTFLGEELWWVKLLTAMVIGWAVVAGIRYLLSV